MAKENTLICRAQSGEEEAFADLMRSYHAFVYTIVIGFVDNSHDAEEVVQDAFLNAYQGLSQLEDTTKFKSWLAEITRNRARNWLRKQHGDTVPLDEVSEEMLQTADSPDERLTRQEQRELIRRTMETLPQKDRDLARAFYLEGASYDELTSTHGLSYNAIASRLSRAKRQLSKRLQYLLTGIFVSPGLSLKKLYTGGLTVMKVGTVPKITVGLAALIALIFLGFVGVHQMNAPTVEERVYLSPWEDGTTRPQNNSEDLAAQTDSAQDRASWDTQSQINTVEMEPIDDFLGQSEEKDVAQFSTDAESDVETDPDLFTDISMLLDNEGQLAEDVMNAYVEAVRSFDGERIRPLMTGAAKEKFESQMVPALRGKFSEEYVDTFYSVALDMSPEMADDMVDHLIQTVQPGMLPLLKQMFGSAKVASSEYVGDELHFRIRMWDPPGTEMPGIPPGPPHKIRKENGVWRIYDSP